MAPSGRTTRPRQSARSYVVQGATLAFQARYPLDQPAYRIVIAATLIPDVEKRKPIRNAVSGPLVIELNNTDLRRPAAEATVVKVVFPSFKVLPENLLPLHFTFLLP